MLTFSEDTFPTFASIVDIFAVLVLKIKEDINSVEYFNILKKLSIRNRPLSPA